MPANVQRVVIMRHGRRADKDREVWPEMISRPWDPPLSSRGERELKEVAKSIGCALKSNFLIYTSPFLRCLQTARVLSQELNNQSEIVVDKTLSEVYDYYSVVRSVNSPDIYKGDSFKSMGCWFGKYRYLTRDYSGKVVYHLAGDSTIKESVFKAGFPDNQLYRITGNFPEFEANYWPFPGLFGIPRFVDEFKDILSKTTNDIVIVTHMSGVTSIVNSIFGYTRHHIAPGAFVVLDRSVDGNQSFELVK